MCIGNGNTHDREELLRGAFHESLLAGALNCLLSQIAILNDRGEIIETNASWNTFYTSNGGSINCDWRGINYLDVCDNARGHNAEEAADVARGIREILAGKAFRYETEYPCHAPNQRRWFRLLISRLDHEGQAYAVLSHNNITERKLIELELQETNGRLQALAITDGLTGLANRRSIDEYLIQAYHRHHRSQQPLSILMIDVDHFKSYNDTLGHQAGDDCLRKIAKSFSHIKRRKDDLIGRYGGEEFVFILPSTDFAGVRHFADIVRRAVLDLNLEHPESATASVVTISIGVATMVPDGSTCIAQLIAAADTALYNAKDQGRNCIVASSPLGNVAAHNNTDRRRAV